MSDDKARFAPVDPVSAGLRGRCPRCGDGALFDGFLTIRPRCSRCGLDFAFADSGDGPAVLLIMVIGFIVVGLALWVEVSLSPPLWVHFLLWIPLALVLCLGALRPLKGVVVAFQYRTGAEQGRIDR